MNLHKPTKKWLRVVGGPVYVVLAVAIAALGIWNLLGPNKSDVGYTLLVLAVFVIISGVLDNLRAHRQQ